MIVTCESCSTQFQLDDAKVPKSGLQVQCSRCDHVFFTGPQACPDVDSPEDLAVDALLSDSRADFDTDSDGLLGEDVGGEGESDWEFNLDGAIADSLGPEELTDGEEDQNQFNGVPGKAVGSIAGPALVASTSVSNSDTVGSRQSLNPPSTRSAQYATAAD